MNSIFHATYWLLAYKDNTINYSMQQLSFSTNNSFFSGDSRILWKFLLNNVNVIKQPKTLHASGNIIYEDKDCADIIVLNSNLNFDKVYAVKDTGIQSNRFFIGFHIHHCNTDLRVFGAVYVFDNNGKGELERTFSESVCGFDWRNGCVYTFFYNQSLVFMQSHRDTSSLLLTLNYLPFDVSQASVSTNTDHTNIIVEYYNDNNFLQVDGNPRFVQLVCKANKFCYIDLGSVDLKTNNTNKPDLVINVYDNIDSVSEPPLFYGSDYPINCINCNKLTSHGTIIEQRSYGATSYLGLGESYCQTCEVRYSKSNCKWVCCKIVKKYSNYICACEHDYPCNDAHDNLVVPTNIKITEPNTKYPYKSDVTLFFE